MNATSILVTMAEPAWMELTASRVCVQVIKRSVSRYSGNTIRIAISLSLSFILFANKTNHADFY